mmetsp:Transcript_518/g.1342  ORF Transcript_518/g.1342 Transcript_518/m.1342 type:complete len:256 (+) Transcript_518:24-791(+)
MIVRRWTVSKLLPPVPRRRSATPVPHAYPCADNPCARRSRDARAACRIFHQALRHRDKGALAPGLVACGHAAVHELSDRGDSLAHGLPLEEEASAKAVHHTEDSKHDDVHVELGGIDAEEGEEEVGAQREGVHARSFDHDDFVVKFVAEHGLEAESEEAQLLAERDCRRGGAQVEQRPVEQQQHEHEDGGAQVGRSQRVEGDGQSGHERARGHVDEHCDEEKDGEGFQGLVEVDERVEDGREGEGGHDAQEERVH